MSPEAYPEGFFIVLVGGRVLYEGSSFEDADRIYQMHKDSHVSVRLMRQLESNNV